MKIDLKLENLRFLSNSIWIYPILFLALFLRLAGINFGLPHLYHADEPIVVNHALSYSTFDFNPHFFRIPPLASYLLFVIYGIFFLLGKIAGIFSSISHFESSFYSNPSHFYFLGRLCLGVIPGTVTVLMLFQLLKKHFSSKIGFTAAFLMAVNFLHVRDSHYIYTDIFLTLSLVVAWGQLWDVINQPFNKRKHFWFGAIAGICCAFKYNGGAIILPYFFASCLLIRPFSKIIPLAGRMILGLLGFYSLLNPYSLLDYQFFLQEILSESDKHGGTSFLWHYLYSLWEGTGTPLWIVSTLAFIASFRTKNLKLMSVGFFTLCYYIILIKSGQNHERYVLFMIPGLIILSSALWTQWTARFPTWVFIMGLVIMMGPNLVKSVLSSRIMRAKDTRTQTKEWIEEKLVPGSKVALDHDFFGPRLNKASKQLEEKKEALLAEEGNSSPKLRKLDFMIQRNRNLKTYELYYLAQDPDGDRRRQFTMSGPFVSFSVKELKDQNIQYVIVTYLNLEKEEINPEFKRNLKEHAHFLNRFSPYKNSQIFPLSRTIMTGSPFTWKELAARERSGYTIEIYKLK